MIEKQLAQVLSSREFEALQLRNKGYRNKEIAKKLNITPTAVKKYISTAKKKILNLKQNSNQTYNKIGRVSTSILFQPYSVRQLLSEREFEALKLRHNGYKMNKVAEIMNISLGTVRVHIHSAKKKIGDEIYNSSHFLDKFDGNADGWTTRPGKEELREKLDFGFSSMAYSLYGDGSVALDTENMLATAINGLGYKGYLLKKRGQVLKAAARSARHTLVTVKDVDMTPEAKELIGRSNIRVIKSDFPTYENEGEGKSRQYLCEGQDLERMLAALLPVPEIEYSDGECNLYFGGLLHLNLVKIYDKKGKVLVFERFNKPQSRVTINVKLKKGKYEAGVQIGKTEVKYLFEV